MRKKKVLGKMFALLCMAGVLSGTLGEGLAAYAVNEDLKASDESGGSEVVLEKEALEAMELKGIEAPKTNSRIVLKESAEGNRVIEMDGETYYLGLDSDEKRVYSEKEIEAMWKEIEEKSKRNTASGLDKITATYSSSNSKKITGKKPSQKGMILVTPDKYKGLIPTGHAAMVWNEDFVIEALSDGVQMGKNNWYSSKENAYGLVVFDTLANGKAAKAADFCVTKLGCPYNINFMDIWNRKKFYCSQLVWAAYYDTAGIDLDTKVFGGIIHPMELYISPLTEQIYSVATVSGYK